MQTKTRLVTVDVVATDSHGATVRGLKPEDFEVTDGRRQNIEKFSFVDKSAAGGAAKTGDEHARPSNFYSNQTAINSLRIPPTVLVMDSLNTNPQDLLQTRRYMLGLLKTLPTDTPVAVFLLGKSLTVVQDFTSDPRLLHTAVERTMSPSAPLDLMPEDDPNSGSLMMFDQNGDQEDEVSQSLEDFEKDTYAGTIDQRVYTTLAALTGIAHYLSGYRGRKNLIWVSEAFPVVLWPDPDFGTNVNEFRSSRDYGGQVEAAANALTDAQVAVYPVDARGLDGSQIFSAAQQPVNRPNSSSRNLRAQLLREDTARAMAQSTMDEMAQETGGKTCKNTNDLSGCVEAALNNSSSYYELSYYPENVKWDGSFRKVSVKATPRGVKLTYRRGYFAQDPETFVRSETPEKRLQQACQDYLPSTAIPVTAQAVAAVESDRLRYLTSFEPSQLSLSPDGHSLQFSAKMAVCIYGAKNRLSQFETRDVSHAVSDADYSSWRASGERQYVDVPRAGAERVRIAVLDLDSGLTGALDVPVRPADEATASNAPAPASSPLAKPPQDKTSTSVVFRLPSGKAAALDWGNGNLMYQGDLPVEQTAAAFFSSFFAKNFHCDAGNLVPNDPTAVPAKTPWVVFTDHAGRTVKVDLKGDQPEYSGALPVDDSAKLFFQRVWFLTHCRTAP